MQQSKDIAIANARKFADITTLLAAAKDADEAREIFAERYPSDREQALTPPEGEANEPKFWLNLIEVAKELEQRCLHLDFDAELILWSDTEAEGREVLYTGRLRDGSKGVIFVPHVLEVIDDPEDATIIDNIGKFFENRGLDLRENQVYYSDGFGDSAPFHERIGQGRTDIGLDAISEEDVAEELRRISRDLIGGEVETIRRDQLLCSLKDADRCDNVYPLESVIDALKTEELDRYEQTCIAINERWALDVTDPYFAAWLWENLTIYAD